METVIASTEDMIRFGSKLGSLLKGGEVLELVGDVGAGKTTFTKGLAVGLGVQDDVQSPTFTISRVYTARDGLELSHYDFYRLTNPGILKIEIEQAVHDPRMITVVEWGEIIEGVLPDSKMTITFRPLSETTRRVTITGGDPQLLQTLGEITQ